MSKQGPCLKCEKRHPHCHSECEDYKAYKEALIERTQTINSSRNEYAMVLGYHKNKARRLTKIYKGKPK